MLSDMSPNPQSNLEPPSFNFASRSPSSTSLNSAKDVSLSVNYLPSKFSRPHSPGIRKRGKGEKDDDFYPKRGGGRDAFRSNESRMPGTHDEDYDGVTGGWAAATKGRLRWNRFKWILFFSNTLLTIYSLVSLIFCLLTLFNVWRHADVVRVGNSVELTLSLLASCIGVVTSLIGWAGLLLNNRSFLAVYTLLLWITFAFLVTPGYVTYKKRTFNLEGKLNAQWSRTLGVAGRLRIQNQLNCCGYFSPYVEATISQTCYSRSLLPGCKGPYIRFEKLVLERWYTVAFSLVPLHLFCTVAALLCSNHVTYRFGKGMMPKAYRLSLGSMAVIMDNYANQLAEQYGGAFASEVLNRSRSRLPLDASMPSMPYASSDRPVGHGHYESLSGAGIVKPGEDYHPKRL